MVPTKTNKRLDNDRIAILIISILNLFFVNTSANLIWGYDRGVSGVLFIFYKSSKYFSMVMLWGVNVSFCVIRLSI